jgi:hypothetical protein
MGGKEKGLRKKSSTFGEEGWRAHSCRPTKTLAIDEGSLGGATEGRAQIVDQHNRDSLPIASAWR